MFSRSRAKIVALIMAVLIVLLLGIIAIIIFVSYADIKGRSLEMLRRYAQIYAVNGLPEGEIGDDRRENHRFQISTFYSVFFSEEGEALEINNDSNLLFTEPELITFAEGLLKEGRSFGTVRNVTYLITREESCTLVTMMDTMVIGESFLTLLRYTMIFAGISILIFLLVSLLLADWIIRPLEEAYQKQKQFISDAGHELKTPVSTISTNAELLARTTGANKWLSNIQYENKRMSDIVVQLLDLARIENGGTVMESTDLSRTVLAAALPFEGTAYENGIEYSCSIQENIHIYGNSGQIGSLVSILLDNAFQHSMENGRITVSLSTSQGSVFLSVTNLGNEIPEEQQEKIFDRFYRADMARNSDAGRYGLGLAIARSIVTAHRGRISVSCEDGCTTFQVVIPQKRGRGRLI